MLAFVEERKPEASRGGKGSPAGLSALTLSAEEDVSPLPPPPPPPPPPLTPPSSDPSSPPLSSL